MGSCAHAKLCRGRLETSAMQLEDTIKLEVRDDLRDLKLDREQYSIAIASAALANERVRRTRLTWQRGIGNVNARDLLEAQRAYTASVSAIANQHIGYIVDRIDLFFDLELLEVNSSGFWPELYDEQHQPTPHFAMPNMPPYGVLPRKVWYSHKVKRMLHIPPGTPAVYQEEQADETESVEAPEPQRLEEPPLPEPVE
jgi:hypothetical protein